MSNDYTPWLKCSATDAERGRPDSHFNSRCRRIAPKPPGTSSTSDKKVYGLLADFCCDRGSDIVTQTDGSSSTMGLRLYRLMVYAGAL